MLIHSGEDSAFVRICREDRKTTESFVSGGFESTTENGVTTKKVGQGPITAAEFDDWWGASQEERDQWEEAD